MAYRLPDESLLTPSDAGRVLGLSSRRVIQLADAGRLPVVRTRLGRLFRLEDVQRLAAERARQREEAAA